eukprot:5440935-Amphidinium_carterae.1
MLNKREQILALTQDMSNALHANCFGNQTSEIYRATLTMLNMFNMLNMLNMLNKLSIRFTVGYLAFTKQNSYSIFGEKALALRVEHLPNEKQNLAETLHVPKILH